MVRSLVLRLASTMTIVAAVVVAVGVSATAAETVSVDGEYVEFEGFHHYHIGPFSDLGMVFHPGGVSDGVPCTADTVTVVQNEVVFTLDPVSASVGGTGLIELSCEYRPGCGAVTRIMEAIYSGDYDAEKQLMTGTVDYWSLDGEMTTWGTKGGLNSVSQCLDRTILEGEAVTTNWVLNVGEANPTGYNTGVIEGDDPAKRYGFFTVPQLVTPLQNHTDVSAGGDGESAGESAADSRDEPASASRETSVLRADGSGSTGMKALFVLLMFLVAGVSAGVFLVAAGIRLVIRLRMGFRR